MAQPETFKVGSEVYKTRDILQPWIERVSASTKEREAFLPQIRINRMFAAGKQHLDVNNRDGRVLEVKNRNIGGVKTKMVTSDRLGQYILAAMGRMAGNDYRTNFTAATEDENSNLITQQMNDAFGWGWDHEWEGDKKLMSILRLLTIDGTGVLRVRYDRKVGDLLGDVPLDETGKPVPEDAQHKYVAKAEAEGRRVNFASIRDGRVKWELGSLENFLWPCGIDDPDEWPWEMIVRPVYVRELHKRYGLMADGVEEEDLENSTGLSIGDDSSKQTGKALVYTAYAKPDSDHKTGCTAIFTKTNLLDYYEELPFSDHPKGPRSGVHTFRWQIIPGRFPGKAFIEAGIGPQKIRNKRETQIDTIIDRNMPKVFTEEQSLSRPKTGEPMEVIEVRPGSPLPQVSQGVPPGAWMLQDVKLQDENIESALGMRGITLGQPPQGISAYSALALLSENDALKLDPIAQELRREVVEVSWDTMEAMRNWPKEKQMEIAGPNDTLRSWKFNKNDIPDRYVASSPRQGALPRSQAAELQKVNDVWQAAMASGKPLPMQWYVDSLNAGKMQPLPDSLADTSKHKAELENIVMYHTKHVVPVSDEDDDLAHVEIHRVFQQQMNELINEGDESAHAVADALEQHCQLHLQKAKEGAVDNSGAGPQTTNGPQGPVPGSPSAGRPPSQNGINLPQAPNGPAIPPAPSMPS